MKKYDVIIVGAGPAGSSAGYILAKAGLDVLIIERGEWPGAKNVSGCLFYPQELVDVIPGFWEEAPIERRVLRQIITLMDGPRNLAIDFNDGEPGQNLKPGITIIRSTFDQWLAEKAVSVGATLITNCLVDNVLMEGSRTIGVHVNRPDGEVYARTVIGADGVNSIIARRSSLATDLPPDQIAIGAKEYIALPREQIEEHFNLDKGKGLAQHFVGVGPNGSELAGFIYTLDAGLSVGLVARLSSLIKHRVNITDLFDWFINRRTVSRLIRGGEVKEFSAHLIPEGGFNSLPRLYGDGTLLVGDAARFIVATGLMLKGMNFAVVSGIAAAETILAAQSTEINFPDLSKYPNFLSKYNVLQELRIYRNAPALLESDRLFRIYPDLACHFSESLFLNGSSPRPKLWQLALQAMRSRINPFQLFIDLIKVSRSL